MSTEANNQGDGEAAEGAVAAAADATSGAQAEAVAGKDAASVEGGAAASSEAAHVRPEGIPDEFWDDATGLKVGDLAAAYRDIIAKDAERTADVPGEADAYDLALPEGFDLPEGIEIEIKADDPLWAGFQTLGKKFGLGKAAFSEFVGEFAKYQVAAQVADVNEYVAQKTALGANADVRIKAASDWMGANLTKSEADALGGALISAEGVKALERIIGLKSGPRATEGAGSTAASKFEGLRGGDLLDAIRTQSA